MLHAYVPVDLQPLLYSQFATVFVALSELRYCGTDLSPNYKPFFVITEQLLGDKQAHRATSILRESLKHFWQVPLSL